MADFRVVFAAALACAFLCNCVTLGQEQNAANKTEEASSANVKGSKQPQSKPLLDIEFATQFDLFNPRNKSSLFSFWSVMLAGQACGAEDNSDDNQFTSNNAAFVFGSPNFINMASLPFGRWASQKAGVNATEAVYDASVKLRGSDFPLNANDILEARLLFSCETFGTADHPFPAEAVANVQDDPRPAACSAFLTDQQQGIEFGIVLTNRGIWAAYNRHLFRRAQKQEKYKAFNVYRRLGDRGVNSIIDARIAINGAAKATRFYVGNQVVWSVDNWGKLSAVSADPKNVVVLESGGNEEAVDIKSLTFFMNTEHKMHQADPNRAANVTLKDSKGLVRLTSDQDYYASDMKFYDEKSKRESSLFNQGAKMSLGRLRIVSFPIDSKQ